MLQSVYPKSLFYFNYTAFIPVLIIFCGHKDLVNIKKNFFEHSNQKMKHCLASGNFMFTIKGYVKY